MKDRNLMLSKTPLPQLLPARIQRTIGRLKAMIFEYQQYMPNNKNFTSSCSF